MIEGQTVIDDNESTIWGSFYMEWKMIQNSFCCKRKLQGLPNTLFKICWGYITSLGVMQNDFGRNDGS